MIKLIKARWFTYITYLLLVLAIALIGFVLIKLQDNKDKDNANNISITSFLNMAENRSFDYRQRIKIGRKPDLANHDIVIVAADDASVEKLGEKYGEWPLPRNIYANIIDHIERENPQAILFDLMFVKSISSSQAENKALVNTMNKYNNIYTSINFDNQPTDVRMPINLPERLKIKINNSSKHKYNKYMYTNCRPILPELLNGKVNVGNISILRDDDGIIRKIPPFVQYKNDYYPTLSFAYGSNYLSKDNSTYNIDKEGNLIIQNKKFPLTPNGDMILNWYGKHDPENNQKTYEHYPMYKVINDIDNGTSTLDFHNKIVIIGTTAISLHDTKSVPIQDSTYPGVEVHATFINNMIDSSFITKTNEETNIIISLLVIALVGFIVMFSTSTIFAVLSTILFGIGYFFVSYYIMELYNLWIPVVIPTILVVFAFAISILVKYLIKSKDFEYQYQLATVDGLTELYNHRYFQDTLRQQIAIAKRYNQEFSLIIIDIDFFKKFNDTYGHQAGDAVLRQVAKTLKKNSRSTDYVCRYGGEEMSIILPNTSKEEVLYNANRILHAVAEKEFYLNETTTGHVTISVGTATFPENAQTPEELIEYADTCLYYAKEHGRNQVGKHSDSEV